jgi:hypothetical protein
MQPKELIMHLMKHVAVICIAGALAVASTLPASAARRNVAAGFAIGAVAGAVLGAAAANSGGYGYAPGYYAPGYYAPGYYGPGYGYAPGYYGPSYYGYGGPSYGPNSNPSTY